MAQETICLEYIVTIRREKGMINSISLTIFPNTWTPKELTLKSLFLRQVADNKLCGPQQVSSTENIPGKGDTYSSSFKELLVKEKKLPLLRVRQQVSQLGTFLNSETKERVTEGNASMWRQTAPTWGLTVFFEKTGGDCLSLRRGHCEDRTDNKYSHPLWKKASFPGGRHVIGAQKHLSRPPGMTPSLTSNLCAFVIPFCGWQKVWSRIKVHGWITVCVCFLNFYHFLNWWW